MSTERNLLESIEKFEKMLNCMHHARISKTTLKKVMYSEDEDVKDLLWQINNLQDSAYDVFTGFEDLLRSIEERESELENDAQTVDALANLFCCDRSEVAETFESIITLTKK